jgi:hypothetical protein
LRYKLYSPFYQKKRKILRENLNQRRLENYHMNKGFNTFKDYVTNHLNKDMEFVRDELIRVDDTDPEEVEYCIELMKLAKFLLIIQSVALGENITELEKIKNIKIPVLFNED